MGKERFQRMVLMAELIGPLYQVEEKLKAEVKRAMPTASRKERKLEVQRRMKLTPEQQQYDLLEQQQEAAEQQQRDADVTEAFRQGFERVRLNLEEKRKQEESQQRALTGEERQCKSTSEKYQPATSQKPQLKSCRACNGLGGKSCSACGGRGYQSRSGTRIRSDGQPEYYQEDITCTYCSGGRVRCTYCGGSGKVVE